MIVYLYGPDSYRRNQRVSFYLEQFKKKHPEAITIEHFDLAEEGIFEKLKRFVVDQSLFGKGYKFAVLRNASLVDAKELKKVFEPILEYKETTIVVSEDKKLDKTLDTLLLKSFHSESFDALEESDFSRFLEAEARIRGLKLKVSDRDLLARLYEGDSWGLIQQLEKMSLGGAPEASLETPELFPLMFQLAGSASLPRKLSALAWLLEYEEPAKVFNIIAVQKNSALQKKMADYDIAVKSGKLEYEGALLDLTLS